MQSVGHGAPFHQCRSVCPTTTPRCVTAGGACGSAAAAHTYAARRRTPATACGGSAACARAACGGSGRTRSAEGSARCTARAGYSPAGSYACVNADRAAALTTGGGYDHPFGCTRQYLPHLARALGARAV